MEWMPAHHRHVVYDGTVPPAMEVISGPGNPDDYPTLELPAIDPTIGFTTSHDSEPW